MSAKRRWWLADERFKKVHRALRMNYEKTLKMAEERLQADFDKKLNAVKDRFIIDQEQIQREAQRLANEIARVRLDFGPARYGARFTMQVSMDENFMGNARDLKEVGPYVIEMLTMKIRREFAQIDFGRVKPVMPATRSDAPVWRIES
jgi:hypothetical protein